MVRASLFFGARLFSFAFFPLWFLCFVFASLPVRAEDIPFPLEKVEAGMKGIGRTVFEGNRVEEFGVEILGVMKNTGPKKHTILARLSEGNLENTGVVAGMSGSPVYIDGKILGAVSATWTFSKSPIAAITPIEEMRDLSRSGGSLPGGNSTLSLLAGRYKLENLLAGNWVSLRDQFGKKREKPEGMGTAGEMESSGLPIIFSGVPGDSFAWLNPIFSGLGLTCFHATGSGATGDRSDRSKVPIVSGEPIALPLVGGDLSVAVLGTATEIRGKELTAFGHPVLNMGDVNWPMARAEILTTVPSIYYSFKLFSVGPVIGRFVQDRAAGVLGRLDEKAPVIPVRFELEGDAGSSSLYQFEMVEDKLLSPFLLDSIIVAFMESMERALGEGSLKFRATLQLENLPDVLYEDTYSGDRAPEYASALTSAILKVLLDNPFGKAKIRGIDLRLAYQEKERTAEIRRIRPEKQKFHAGESVNVKVYLRSKEDGEVSRDMTLKIPDSLQPGKYLLVAGSGKIIQAIEQSRTNAPPDNLLQLVEYINRLKKNCILYAILLQQDSGFSLKGERFSFVPPSVYAIFRNSVTSENFRSLRRTTVLEASVPTDYSLDGYKIFLVEVEKNLG